MAAGVSLGGSKRWGLVCWLSRAGVGRDAARWRGSGGTTRQGTLQEREGRAPSREWDTGAQALCNSPKGRVAHRSLHAGGRGRTSWNLQKHGEGGLGTPCEVPAKARSVQKGGMKKGPTRLVWELLHDVRDRVAAALGQAQLVYLPFRGEGRGQPGKETGKRGSARAVRGPRSEARRTGPPPRQGRRSWSTCPSAGQRGGEWPRGRRGAGREERGHALRARTRRTGSPPRQGRRSWSTCPSAGQRERSQGKKRGRGVHAPCVDLVPQLEGQGRRRARAGTAGPPALRRGRGSAAKGKKRGKGVHAPYVDLVPHSKDRVTAAPGPAQLVHLPFCRAEGRGRGLEDCKGAGREMRGHTLCEDSKGRVGRRARAGAAGFAYPPVKHREGVHGLGPKEKGRVLKGGAGSGPVHHSYG